MDGIIILRTILTTLCIYGKLTFADHDQEYMVSTPESLMVPQGFETKITCEMNIPPDKFQWKFYPLPPEEASNPKAFINLTSTNFKTPSAHLVFLQKGKSSLTLENMDKSMAGDYQCLAHYGAFVVASVPWRITLATLNNVDQHTSLVIKSIKVVEGNTVNWRCEPPESNPEAYVDYLKNSRYISPENVFARNLLVLNNVTTNDSGRYTCQAGNSITAIATIKLLSELDLKVVSSDMEHPPMFIIPPKSVYIVNKGDSVFMECAAVGNPIPHHEWKKRLGTIDATRSQLVSGGLVIKNVSSNDEGVYECVHKNKLTSIQHLITLIYNEPPRIDCLDDSRVEVNQGDNLDLNCTVTGIPEPRISWFLNGYSVVNDRRIEAIGNKIYFRSVEKKHAGNLQIFARNTVETVYKSIRIFVIPLPTTADNVADKPMGQSRRFNKNGGFRKNSKHNKLMVPPSKPIIIRLNDEAVVVRWNVSNKHGLPIQFFKVQYRDLGPGNSHEHHNKGKGSKWNTSEEDIPANIRNKEVNNLKSDHWYRFRIAAVYTNNDNKNSPNSEKFFLKKMDFYTKNPLPIPMVTKTDTINSTAVRIHWKTDTTSNVSVSGFFVMYNSASSAADYSRAAVDDPKATSFILTSLQPATVYDIKLQSMYKDLTSEFSSIMKARTAAESTTVLPTVVYASSAATTTETPGFSKLYIIIAVAVVGACAIIVGAIGLLIFCRKWKQKKNGNRDKPGVDDHHIQVDGNEYIVGPKNTTRSNGCLPPNRITITANPLADADNKNQNMIEMSCLSSQNNNCSSTAVQPSVSGEDSSSNISDKTAKNRDKRIRNKQNVDANTSGENYV